MNIKTILIAISMLFLSVNFAHANTDDSDANIEGFLRYLINQAEYFAKDKTVTEEERHHNYLHLFRETFDVPKIGRFVLGKYWRKATIKQKTEFLDIFELVTVKTFAPILSKFPIDDFSIKKIKRIESRPDTVLVYTIIRRVKDSPIHIIWHVDRRTGVYRILDVKAEGVSLLVTLRSEYASYISREGGIDGLLVILQKKLEK